MTTILHSPGHTHVREPQHHVAVPESYAEDGKLPACQWGYRVRGGPLGDSVRALSVGVACTRREALALAQRIEKSSVLDIWRLDLRMGGSVEDPEVPGAEDRRLPL